MITVPSVSTRSQTRLYRDSDDAQLLYVDLLQPAAVHGESATRWMPIPGGAAYLVGEVRFGPGPDDYDDVPGLVPGQRSLPMPWEIAQVFAWYRHGDGIEVVARGKTSGFSTSNAVFNGSAPLAAMISPVLISAELVCKACLVGAQVNGKGDATLLREALHEAPLGERAAWDATLSEVLIDLLTGLEETGSVGFGVSLSQAGTATDVLGELHMLTLLEWAHRIQQRIAPELTLAAPAGLVKSADLVAPVSLDLDCPARGNLSFRAVRVLRPKAMGHSVPHC